MQPSSLIFLVIIAIWAAYFIQYWVRRREHLATASSVDRFSESMRVLERRSSAEADVTVPQRSYAVSPARASRPQATARAEGEFPQDRTHRPTPDRWTGDRPKPDRSTGSGSGSLPRRGSGQGRKRAGARRARGLTFLGSFVLLLGAVPLAAFSLIPWLGLLLPGAAVAGSFLWLRRGVAAARSDRHRGGHGEWAASRAASAAAPSRDGVSERPVTHPDNAGSSGLAKTTSGVDEQDVAASPAAEGLAPGARRGSALYDIQAVEASDLAAAGHPGSASTVVGAAGVAAPAAAAPATAATPLRQPARPLVDDDDIPLTWDPVPVPRPTYTMKAKAERPNALPAEVPAAQHGEHPAYQQSAVPRAVGD